MIPLPACSLKASYVYLFRSKSTGRFYLGWTADLNRRLREHNDGKSKYTKNRGPWELVYHETYSNPEQAKERERKLKRNPKVLFLLKKRALMNLVLAEQRQVVG